MNTRKIQALFCTLFIAMSFIACKKSETILQDGIFVGAGEGKDGPITVSITITGGKVTDAEIISDSENPEISDVAKRRIMQLFKTSGTTKNIDAISGATLTSRGLIEALDAALISATGKKSKKQVYTDTKCDIAIIGAGGAGLIAATEAASKGAHVIVLEKMGIVGGNSNFSTGGINAAYTKEQERLGITDDKETFYDDTMKGGYYMNDGFFFQAMLHEMEEINKTGNRAFLYGITMENHQPFEPDKFGYDHHVAAESDLLDEDETAILDVGLEGLYRADLGLGELVTALRASSRVCAMITPLPSASPSALTTVGSGAFSR